MRVLWPHNFNPQKPNSGVFMHIAAKGLEQFGVTVHLEYLGNLRNPISVLSARKKLQKLATKFDLVHAQFGSACALATAGIKGIPKVLSLRGSDWNTYDGSNQFFYWHTRSARWFTLLSIEKYDYVIAVSQRIRNELTHKFPNVKCSTIPAPINLKLFTPKDKFALRKEMGIVGPDEKWVLFNSNSLHNPIKRYELAKEAIELASQQNNKIRMKILNNLPHSEVPDFVAACDLILCTSTAEGWPNSVKEALACNIPFVSTDVSDLSLIAEKESSCKICPADPKLIAEAVMDSITHPSNFNLRRYVETMDLEQTSKVVFDLYQKLLR